MAWADFDSNSALERTLLERALPLVPTSSDGSSSAVIDMAANTAQVAVTVSDTLGPTPDGCVALLGIRPLLVAAAWKVIDLLLEEALDAAGETPDLKRGFTIKKKAEHAQAGDAQPTAISTDAWRALGKSYAATVELRHSLVHRNAHLDPSGSLVGVDDAGAPLRPLTVQEQEAIARAALRAAQLVITSVPDDRIAADLIRHLSALQGLHGETLPPVSLAQSLPEIAALLDPDSTGLYPFEVPHLRARQPFRGAEHADLIVRFRDRPGQELRGRLEDAPDQSVVLDPDNPPAWLT